MNLSRYFFLFTGLLLLASCNKKEFTHLDTSSRLIQQAKKEIENLPKDPDQTRHIVKVVYFHGNDQAPLKDWKKRLNRTLKNVSNYYADEILRYGIKTSGIPFETNNNGIAFHLIEGDSASLFYNKNSGQQIQNEIYRKTNGSIDFSKDHVLIINGLCYQKPDGTYVFHAPYHGSGSKTNGVCHVADCELLDADFLTNVPQRMVFSEMMVARKECTVAEFNSWYIGGIAHEMGHIFGLPHDFGNPSELNDSSISLMGQYGSRHYKDYLWGGEKSSHFSSAGIFQLISHPLFSGTSKSKQNINLELKDMRIESDINGLSFNALYKTNGQPYGAVALLHPANSSPYYNRSYKNVIDDPEKVTIEFGTLNPSTYSLLIMFLYTDGSFRTYSKVVSVDKNGKAELYNSINNSRVDIDRLYTKLSNQTQTETIKTKLRILDGILHPPEFIEPNASESDSLFLSDALWEEARVGWENAARNYFTREREATFFLELKGRLYLKGLYAHSPSLYKFNLEKKWNHFSATIGLRDYAHIEGSARFTVMGDGKLLFESSALRKNQQEKFDIDVSDVDFLELKTEGTEGHNHNSWAIWLTPLLKR